MHRLIMQPPANMTIDHIDCNGLNNQKHNLRICTKQQNHMNRKNGFGLTKYKGVGKSGNTKNPWRAYIKINQKYLHIGCYPTQEKAAEAYNQRASILFGEFANLNEVAI